MRTRRYPETTRDPQPTVGVLTIGSERSGITIYDGHLASLMRAAGHDVTRSYAAVTGRALADLESVVRAARTLADREVIIASYSRNQWGAGWVRLGQALVLALSSRSRLVVFLHDVDEAHRWGRGTPYRRPHMEAAVLAVLVTASRATVVHTSRDRDRLSWKTRHGVTIIPHVTNRVDRLDRTAARRRLDVGDGLVLCCLGFIHDRKDPLLAVRALAELPSDTQLWFAGQVSPKATVTEGDIRAEAQRLGVADRVTITGYLDDGELMERIAATDIGLCLFRDVSASGSLAMWFAAATPVVGSDIPGLREFAAKVPPMVLAASDRPGDVAAAIMELACRKTARQEFSAVLEASSPAVVTAQLQSIVRAVARR